LKEFDGYHSEWNLGSPGGFCYQRNIQLIGKEVWQALNRISSIPVVLDFEHFLLYPDRGFIEMLVQAHREREGNNPGLIAVVAEEETLEAVTENRDLARWLSNVEGITGALTGPREIELKNGRVCYRGRQVSIIFLDFNIDVLLSLHRTYDLSPLIQAVRERRVINPRGTEPINAKSIFEVTTGPNRHYFHEEIISRTPWTRQFYPRQTTGPDGERIGDLFQWTMKNWDRLVLKPERGYSGKGVRVGDIHDSQSSIQLAQDEGMSIEHSLVYLLGPIKMALRPRLITELQLNALSRYCMALWKDCLTLEEMWLAGTLDSIVKIDPEELEIIHLQPWKGAPAIIASDGLFNFGAQKEKEWG